MPQSFGNRVIMPAGIELTLEAEKHVVLNNTMSVLSVGSGTGELESYLAEKYGCRITGVDLSRESVDIAQAMCLKKGQNGSLNFVQGDCKKLSYNNEYFDMVFACGSLSEFFEDGVREISRVLKRGGKAVIIDIALMGRNIPENLVRDWLRKDIRILNLDEALAYYQKSGFDVIYSKAYYEPSWWDVFYNGRGQSRIWEEEYKRYLKYREHIAITLYILSKEPDSLTI